MNEASSLLTSDAFWIALGGVISLIMCTCAFLSDTAASRQRERESAAHTESQLKAELALRGEFDEWLADELLRLQIDCAASPGDQDKSARLAAMEIAKEENTARIVALHQGNAKPDHGATEAVKGRWQFVTTAIPWRQTAPTRFDDPSPSAGGGVKCDTASRSPQRSKGPGEDVGEANA